jgi:hypothetical protein
VTEEDHKKPQDSGDMNLPLEYKSVLNCLSEVNCTALSELYDAINADKFIEFLFM